MRVQGGFAKVGQYYRSEAHFERFVQASLLSLSLRDFYSYPPLIKTCELFAEHAAPWLELLAELDFQELHAAWAGFVVDQV